MTEFRFSEEYPYYVYVHYRNDNGQPFYVGMGKKYKTRINTKNEYQRSTESKERSDYWHNIVNKHGYTIEIFMDNLTHEEAVDKEKELISLYGRTKTGGRLCNLTSGGEGKVGYIAKESTKLKLRDINLIPVEKAIFDNTFPEPNTGCFLWSGSVFKGRAYINVDNKSYPANKFLYEYYTGVKLENGQFVNRTCGNKLCVNPDHFSVGGYTDRDIQGVRERYTHYRQVLNVDTVREMRLLAKEGVKPRAIAEKYGVSRASVAQMLAGKSWGWVK